MSTEKEFGFNRIVKILMLVVSPAIFILGLICIIDCHSDDNLFGILFTGIPIVFVSIFTFISPLISKIRCGDDYIERIGFGSRKIMYDEIKKIWLSEDHIILKSSIASIKIGWDFDRQKEIIGIVIDKLRNNPNLEIKGSKKNKLKYFPERNSQ